MLVNSQFSSFCLDVHFCKLGVTFFIFPDIFSYIFVNIKFILYLCAVIQTKTGKVTSINCFC